MGQRNRSFLVRVLNTGKDTSLKIIPAQQSRMLEPSLEEITVGVKVNMGLTAYDLEIHSLVNLNLQILEQIKEQMIRYLEIEKVDIPCQHCTFHTLKGGILERLYKQDVNLFQSIHVEPVFYSMYDEFEGQDLFISEINNPDISLESWAS